MTRRPHQRNIWAGSERQGRAFHRARLFGAVKAMLAFVRGIEPMASGHGRYHPAARLAALEAADLAAPYLDEEAAVRLSVEVTE